MSHLPVERERERERGAVYVSSHLLILGSFVVWLDCSGVSPAGAMCRGSSPGLVPRGSLGEDSSPSLRESRKTERSDSGNVLSL
jgi:hypothetical protein